MTVYVNLTAQEITLLDVDTHEPLINVEPSGEIAGRRQEALPAGKTPEGVALFEETRPRITGLPEPAEDTIYIVGPHVRAALGRGKRPDVYMPGDKLMRMGKSGVPELAGYLGLRR